MWNGRIAVSFASAPDADADVDGDANEEEEEEEGVSVVVEGWAAGFVRRAVRKSRALWDE